MHPGASNKPIAVFALVTALLGVVSCGEAKESEKRVKAKRYLNTSEARAGMYAIMDGAKAYLAERGTLPASAPMTPPEGACCTEAAREVAKGLGEEGRKCAADPTLWATPAWQAYGFQLDAPHRCSFSVLVSGDDLTIESRCDIDCDGVLASFSIAAKRSDGELIAAEEVTVANDAE